MMKRMAAGQFKATCLSVLDDVKSTGEPVVVTKHGKPVAKVVPIEPQDDDIFGFMAGRAKIIGDIVKPAVDPDEWETLEEWDSLR
jgi:prevent-host-death family protein